MELKPGDEHFVVEEIPAYEASGDGEHLWLTVRKVDCTTPVLAQALAAACGVREKAVGWAGRKDRHGITTQNLTVHFGDESGLTSLTDHLPPGASAEVLAVSRHRNKLKPGHLAGNRFRLGITGVEDIPAFAARLTELAAQGLPNAYGRQRFGRDGRNLERALATGRGEAKPPRNKGQRRYLADAAQAAVFDAVLAGRRAAGLLTSLRAGDVAMTPRGAAFVVMPEDADDCNARCAAGELRTSGPLPGEKLLRARPDDEERAWAACTGIDWAWLDGGILASRGDRRPLLAPFLEAPSFDVEQRVLAFALPPGSYATTVCTELGITLP